MDNDSLVTALPFLVLGGALFFAVIYWLNHRGGTPAKAQLQDDDTPFSAGLILDPLEPLRNNASLQNVTDTNPHEHASHTCVAHSDSGMFSNASDSSSDSGPAQDTCSSGDSGGSDSGGSDCGCGTASSSDN
jgi:hypothetical protein